MKRARILVVDDQPDVVQLVQIVLTRQGYEVFSATSAREALEAATDGLRIDLILSDVVMPDMSGPELIRQIRQHSPSVAAVLMSGFSAHDVPADIPFIHKPFSAAHLLSVVSHAVNKAGTGDS